MKIPQRFWYTLIAGCVLPFMLSAQLDRIQPGMTEGDFRKKVPEARRSPEAEAQWISKPDSIDEIPGNSDWRILNDTISEYSFRSVIIPGPSSEFPKADSAEIHEVKESLEGLRKELEATFGKPTRFRNAPLLKVGEDKLNCAYEAVWVFGERDDIAIRLTTNLGAPNMINAPVQRTKPEWKNYELEISVQHRAPLTVELFEVSKSSAQFFTSHPELADQKKPASHVYLISDSVRLDYDEWRFEFEEGKLVEFSYQLYLGDQYGGMASATAYKISSQKTETLFDEGKKSFGNSDSLGNLIQPDYTLPDMRLHHHLVHFYSRWVTKSGNVILKMEEIGGGKEPGTFFHVTVQYGVYW